MYYHKAMWQEDAPKFLEAIKKEFRDMIEKGILKIIKKSRMPEGATVFSSVWGDAA